MLAIFVALNRQYDDVTSVNQPRLGAQTVSHTTAFAKGAEINRGTLRTVDYVRSTLKGPMTQFLSMEYAMSRDLMGRKRHTVYIDKMSGFVSMTKAGLPDKSIFEVFGAGAPDERTVKTRDRMEAMQFAMALDQLKLQLGLGEPLNYDEIQRQVLHEGGWIDVDPFFGGQRAGGDGAVTPAVAGSDPGNAGANALVLQSVAGR